VLDAVGDGGVGVVGDAHRGDGELLELVVRVQGEGREALGARDAAQAHQARAAVDRGAVGAGDDAGRARVVEVAVGDEHVVDALQPDARGLEARSHRVARETGVDEQAELTRPDQAAVAGASAGEDLEVHVRAREPNVGAP
jgi:hypothetical protein